MSGAELFALCEKKDVGGIVSFVSGETNKNQKARKLSENLAACHHVDVRDMWSSLYSLAAEAILSLDENEENEEKIKEAFSFLGAVVFVAGATLNNNVDEIPQCLFETAVLLHGVLMSLSDEDADLKSEIANLLEHWWKQGLQGKEELGINLLHYFVESAQSFGKVSAAKVKRIWGIHEAANLVNLKTSEVAALKERLLASIYSRIFVKEPDGRKFLAFLLCISPDFTEQLFVCFKENFPFASKEMSSFYGEIFFRAWKQATGPCLEKIENDCIQNLMHHAIYSKRGGANQIFSLLSRLLQYIHNQKIQRGVNDMLLKLYNPILWRALNVPNCDVRANAIFLLCDVFPLTCPVDKDELINKQCEAMLAALYDDYPVARRITVEGVCRILSSYWEMLPSATIKLFLSKLLQDHLNDANSTDVRLGVVRGMTQLLDNHLCHPLLKHVLPTMQGHIHDLSETVRKAMLDLLLKVKKIKAIKFWTIVPVEDLLARLKQDSPSVCKKVVKLLINSYMPLEQTPEEKISRLTHLIKEDSVAARRFFQFAPDLLSMEDTVKYLTLIARVMMVLMKRAQTQASDNTSDSINSNTSEVKEDSSLPNGDDVSDSEDSELSLKNTDIMMGLVEAMYLMWDAIATQLHTPKYTDIRHELQKRYSVIIPQMLKTFQDPRAFAAILLLSGFLPSTRVLVLSDTCMSKLRNMTAENHIGHTQLENFISTMCKWRFSTTLLEMIETSLKAGLEERTIAEYKPGGSTVKKKSARCVMLKETIKPEPAMAVEYLEILLQRDMCREVILADHVEALNDTKETLAQSVDILKGLISAGEDTTANNEDLVLKTFLLYLRLTLLLHKHEETDPKPVFSKLLKWAMSDLIPLLSQGHGKESTTKRPRHDGELASKTLEILMKMSWHVLMLGSGDVEFMDDVGKLCTACLEEDKSLQLLETIMTCLRWVAEARCTYIQKINGSEHLLELVTTALGKVFICLANYIKHNRESCGEVVLSVKPQITEIFNRTRTISLPSGIQELYAVTLMAVVAELAHASKKERLDDPTNIQDLPVLSGVLMKIISTPVARLHQFLEEMKNFLDSGSVPDLHHIHGCAYLLVALTKTRGRLPSDDLTKCKASLLQCVHTFSVQLEGEDDDDGRGLLKRIRSLMDDDQEEE